MVLKPLCINKRLDLSYSKIMNNTRIKKYESQALAITMVIMVVSSIIAMSIYFRSQKDKTLTLEERASAEALEISDLLIDKLTVYPVKDIIDQINLIRISEQKEPFNYVEGTIDPLIENSTYSDISQLLNNLDTTTNIRNLSICSVSEGSNEYQLTIRQADENTYFEIRPGQIWSLPTKGLDINDQCSVNIKFEVRGSTKAGFVLIKSYRSVDSINSTYKNYDYEDITSYCFANSSGECNSLNENFFDDNWQPYDITNSEHSLPPIQLKETIESEGVTYVLDEIRIKAIGGTIGLKYTSTPIELDCLAGLRMMHLRVSANCYGIYRGKEVLIPDKKWHNSLFDYVIFNAEGSI